MSDSYKKHSFCSVESFNKKIWKMLKRKTNKKIRKMSFEISDQHFYRKMFCVNDREGIGYKRYVVESDMISPLAFKKYIINK